MVFINHGLCNTFVMITFASPSYLLALGTSAAVMLGLSTPTAFAGCDALVNTKFISPRGGDNPDAPNESTLSKFLVAGVLRGGGEAFDRYDVKTIEARATRTKPSRRWAVDQPSAHLSPGVGLSNPISVGEPIARLERYVTELRTKLPEGQSTLSLEVNATRPYSLSFRASALQLVEAIELKTGDEFGLFQIPYSDDQGGSRYFMIDGDGNVCRYLLHHNPVAYGTAKSVMPILSPTATKLSFAEVTRPLAPQTLLLAGIGTTVDVELRETRPDGTSVLKERRALDRANSRPVEVGPFRIVVERVDRSTATIRLE
jgi:hypothetical protein